MVFDETNKICVEINSAMTNCYDLSGVDVDKGAKITHFPLRPPSFLKFVRNRIMVETNCQDRVKFLKAKAIIFFFYFHCWI